MKWCCDICIESLDTAINEEEFNYIICTPCGHVFHFKCINDWFSHSNSCPTCRKCCSHMELKRIFLSTLEYDSDPEIIHNNNENGIDFEEEMNFLKSVNQSLQEQYDLISISNKELCQYKDKYDTVTMLNISLEEQVADMQLNINMSKNRIQSLQEDFQLQSSTIEALEQKLLEANYNLSELKLITERNIKTVECYKFDSEQLKKYLNDKINVIIHMTDIKTANKIRINELEVDNNCLRNSIAILKNDTNENELIEMNERQYFQVEMQRIS